MLPYWTKAKGTKGRTQKPEDFVVKEILHRKYFAKYKRGKRVSRLKGKYNLFLMRKKNMTTHDALKILFQRNFSEKFHHGNIGFAGLKDKFAVTEQYLTMRNGKDFADRDLELIKVGTTDRMLSKGNLLGNEFTITLHGCSIKNLPKAVAEINKGFPNYFGPQRFGIHGNHIIGRLVVKRKFGEALKLINKNQRKKYKDILRVPKERLKFFVNAYQAWIFNELLSEYARKRKQIRGYLPIIGCNTKNPGKAKAIMKSEGIKPLDFKISELRFACLGSRRKAFIKTSVDYSINGGVKLKFSLPSGSYATVLLREICKGNFMNKGVKQ